jgi:putative addiction module component (TIGR02574 family)
MAETKMRASDIPKTIGVTKPEKILLDEKLWDSIVSDESGVPVPQTHVKELDKRFRRYKSHPGTLLSIEELQSRIARRK